MKITIESRLENLETVLLNSVKVEKDHTDRITVLEKKIISLSKANLRLIGK